MKEKEIEPFELEISTLGFYVNRAFWGLIKILNKELKQSGLDLPHAEFTIIKALEVLQGATQSQIAKVLDKERSGISRSLVSLEKKGYICKAPLNGKSNFVILTEKGKDTLPKINEVIDKISEQALKGFSKRSRESLMNNLTRIYENSMEHSN